MIIGIKVGPIEGKDGLGAAGQKVGNPSVPDGFEVELGVGQGAIDLLCGGLGHQSANAGQAGPDSGNGQGCGMEDAGGGIGDRENPLFMHSREVIMNKADTRANGRLIFFFMAMK